MRVRQSDVRQGHVAGIRHPVAVGDHLPRHDIHRVVGVLVDGKGGVPAGRRNGQGTAVARCTRGRHAGGVVHGTCVQIGLRDRVYGLTRGAVRAVGCKHRDRAAERHQRVGYNDIRERLCPGVRHGKAVTDLVTDGRELGHIGGFGQIHRLRGRRRVNRRHLGVRGGVERLARARHAVDRRCVRNALGVDIRLRHGVGARALFGRQRPDIRQVTGQARDQRVGDGRRCNRLLCAVGDVESVGDLLTHGCELGRSDLVQREGRCDRNRHNGFCRRRNHGERVAAVLACELRGGRVDDLARVQFSLGGAGAAGTGDRIRRPLPHRENPDRLRAGHRAQARIVDCNRPSRSDGPVAHIGHGEGIGDDVRQARHRGQIRNLGQFQRIRSVLRHRFRVRIRRRCAIGRRRRVGHKAKRLVRSSDRVCRLTGPACANVQICTAAINRSGKTVIIDSDRTGKGRIARVGDFVGVDDRFTFKERHRRHDRGLLVQCQLGHLVGIDRDLIAVAGHLDRVRVIRCCRGNVGHTARIHILLRGQVVVGSTGYRCARQDFRGGTGHRHPVVINGRRCQRDIARVRQHVIIDQRHVRGVKAGGACRVQLLDQCQTRGLHRRHGHIAGVTHCDAPDGNAGGRFVEHLAVVHVILAHGIFSGTDHGPVWRNRPRRAADRAPGVRDQRVGDRWRTGPCDVTRVGDLDPELQHVIFGVKVLL